MTVPRLGAWRTGGAVEWRVWAPGHRRLEVVLYAADGRTELESDEMRPADGDCFTLRLTAPESVMLYKLRVDGEGPFPDPWSAAQPLGVHGPSAVPLEPPFEWHDGSWRGVPLDELVLYEVHVGAATPEGTLDALIGKLDGIRSLGATAVELMPLASFPGRRNWGYDGVSLNAPAEVYGGPGGVRRFVDAAHARGLGVLIDVVYNHFGPDGNYLACYSPHYFTHRHRTPWGDGINYDGPESATVRELILRNAEMWIRDYHADGLRLDATHSIQDDSPKHILQEIGERAHAAATGRTVLVIAEDERNQAKLLKPIGDGGYGLDAVWADDFHHSLRRAFAGDADGYFADFTGAPRELAETVREGWFYTGQHSEHHGGPRGTPPEEIDLPRFVYCIQNHDQIGNRAFGDRLSVAAGAFKTMSALLLFAPETPLIFMGQEWMASTPFLYFTDHHSELGRAVTEGRRREFRRFTSFASGDIPDPQMDKTFERSKLDWDEVRRPEHQSIREWYRALLSLRATHPCMRDRARNQVRTGSLGEHALYVTRQHADRRLTLLATIRGRVEPPSGSRLLLTSDDARFGGCVGDSMAAIYEH